MKHSTSIGAFIVIGVATTAPFAQEATFKTYGFVDVELTHSYYKTNDFLAQVGVLKPGTQLNLNHVNAYLDWRPNSRIRTLAEVAYNPDPTQLLQSGMIVALDSGRTMTLAPSGKSAKNNGISLERVHVDIGLSDAINVRVGKFLTPAGIWNVDHGSPTITTINKPFETTMQIFPASQTGAQLLGHLSAGDHDLSYASWVTSGRGSGFDLTSYGGQVPQNLDDWAVGAHIQADLAYLDGIRLGGTLHTGTLRDSWLWTTNTPMPDMAKSTASYVDSSYIRENCFGLDTKLQWMSFTLQAEWNHRQVLNLMNDQAQTNFNAWYGILSRRLPIGDGKDFDVTPYAMFERISFTKPMNNPGLGLIGIPALGFDTYVAGLNFGVFSNIRLKTEYAYVVQVPRNEKTGMVANSFSRDDLAYSKLAAQLSDAF